MRVELYGICENNKLLLALQLKDRVYASGWTPDSRVDAGDVPDATGDPVLLFRDRRPVRSQSDASGSSSNSELFHSSDISKGSSGSNYSSTRRSTSV